MTAALRATGVSLAFGDQPALRDVDLSVEAGEVRALVGQNGSGKSTMIKILAGYYQPDAGEVRIHGQPLRLGVAASSAWSGLRFVHQDLGLVETLNVMENLALGDGFQTRYRLIDWRAQRRDAQRAIDELGYDFDVRRPVAELSISERTAVAIARALSDRRGPASVLILDEPTANLPATEAERLFEVVREVSRRGVAVVFVSHRLEEALASAVSVTVLRDGRHVATRSTEGLMPDELVELMIGRRPQEYDQPAVSHTARGDALLEVTGLASDRIRDLSLSVRAGEIVGIAGITGSGRESVGPALFGARPRNGRVAVAGSDIPDMRPDLSIEAGVGFVPAERRTNAAFRSATLGENLLIASVRDIARWGLFRRGKVEHAESVEWIKKLDVRPPSPSQSFMTLSGGNQQKVIIARWLRKQPRVLILDEPTQGVDVGAKEEIHALIDAIAADGTAVVVISSDHPELIRLCQRVVVVRDGCGDRVLAGDSLTEEQVTAATLEPVINRSAQHAASPSHADDGVASGSQ